MEGITSDAISSLGSTCLHPPRIARMRELWNASRTDLCFGLLSGRILRKGIWKQDENLDR